MPELFDLDDKSIVDEILLLRNVEISSNICKNCEFLVSMPRFNLTYSEFKIRKNGRTLSQLSEYSENYEAPPLGIMNFAIHADDQITIDSFNASGNEFEIGSVLRFTPIEGLETYMPQYHKPNIKVTNGSTF